MWKMNKRLLQLKWHTIHKSVRNIQVSVIGAGGEVGANVSLLFKQNHRIKKLQLYDEGDKIMGAEIEMSHLPGGPVVSAFAADNLHEAIRSSNLIVMVHRVSRKPGNTRQQMITANAPALQRLCRAIAEVNPDAFLAIATNPINSMVPFASSLLYQYGAYNPFKVFGITYIDTARALTYTAKALQVSCQQLSIPVIGGHSDETVIPLFSYIRPMEYALDHYQADSLTQLVRRSGTEIVYKKQGYESAVLGVAWSINEFCSKLLEAICGGHVIATCYTSNPEFGTRFFAGPTSIGPDGIIEACNDFTLNDYENYLVSTTVPIINKDVCLGEDYVKYLCRNR